MARARKRTPKTAFAGLRRVAQAEAALRAPSERLDLVMRAINEGVYDYDIAADKIYYSPRVYEVLDVPKSKLKTAADWRALIHPDDLKTYLAAFAAHVKGKSATFQIDHRYRARKGDWRWARQHGMAQRDAKGRAVRMVGSIGDITDLKNAENALRASEERYDVAMGAINEGVYDWDITTGKVYYSDRVRKVLGLSKADLGDAQDWLKRIHPEDVERYRSAHRDHFKGLTERVECDYRYRAKDGTWRWSRSHGVALRDGDGRAIRMIGSTGDITELKRIEQALKESEERYALATRAATEGIYEWNLESGSLYLSDRSKLFFAVEGEDLTPAVWNERIHGEDYQGYRDALAAHFKGQKPYFEHEYRLRNAAGSYSWVLDRGTGVRNSAGRVIRMVGAVSDITQRKLAEIELRRRTDEVTSALDRQTATAEILQVISRSQKDVQPVFDAIAESSLRLLKGWSVVIWRVEGEQICPVSFRGGLPGSADVMRDMLAKSQPLTSIPFLAEALRDRVPKQIRDSEAKGVASFIRDGARIRGWRSNIAVPMLQARHVIGMITLSRAQPGGFTEQEIGLLKTFADQAVIAIENARLFNETKESLDQQRASAEVLKVVSSSVSDSQPVFDAIVAACARLFPSYMIGINVLGEDRKIRMRASYGIDHESFAAALNEITRPHRGGGLPLRGKLIQFPDIEVEGVPPTVRDGTRLVNARAIIYAPLVNEGRGIGSLWVARKSAGAFSDKESALLQTFAEQAVIAIRNAKLFNETQEALERQTATSNILAVISKSATDLQPVFEAILEHATKLCDAHMGILGLYDGKHYYTRAQKGATPAYANYLAERGAYVPEPDSAVGRTIRSGTPTHVHDVREYDTYKRGNERARRLADLGGGRTYLVVPMLRDAQVIGSIAIYRPEVRPFTQKQIDLLASFANQAVIAIENARLFNETKEALERQTATADVLAAISGAQTELDPVFDAIARNVHRLCGAMFCNVLRYDGQLVHMAASRGFSAEQLARLREKYPVKVDDPSVLSTRVIQSRNVEHIDDVLADPHYDRAHAATAGWRRMLGVPMLRDGAPIGVIVGAWRDPGKTPNHHVELLQTFAAQAVIAIENVRLFNETKEALERQTATAEILKVISSSPTDVQPVFDTIVQSARRLLSCKTAVLLLRRATDCVVVGNSARGVDELPAQVRALPLDREKNFPSRVILDGEVLHIPDWQADDVIEHERLVARTFGIGSGIQVPLLRQGQGIGALAVARAAKGPFHEKEIALLRSFADQAVIAIENVRLFNETKEALEQQTAISEVLRVISSSPSDVVPVLDAVATRAARICESTDAQIFLVEDGKLRNVAGFGEVPLAIKRGDTLPIDRESINGRAVVDRKPVQIVGDVPASELPRSRRVQERSGWRTGLAVPLLREQRALGTINLRRMVERAFSDKQIELLKTFADQAAIAIENVRLFKETQESLERQTATAEVLKTISRSTFDLDKVLQALLDNAARLGGARQAVMMLPDADGNYLPTCWFNWGDEIIAQLRARPPRASRDSTSGRVLLEKRPIHIPDVRKDPDYGRQDLIELGGYRSVLSVPMLRDSEAIGLITLTGIQPFSDKQIELITTFADQAGIAIENVRLFREIEEKSRQLEVASQHKSQFLASMSHELRTPLNAILGFNEMLLGGIYGDVPDEMQEPLKDIQTSGKHLLRLINNVLDLAKIEAGRMELALAEYSVHDTVAGVQATLRPLAAEKGLDFVASVPEDIPSAYGDAGRLTQCLMNLAGNSLKFTKTGKVQIAVAQENGTLRYSVSDTGIGIPPDKIGSLFTEFKQTDATIASEYGGTGLGLSITKKFIEMHGGRIWVESEMGRGSSFIFEIPLRAEP